MCPIWFSEQKAIIFLNDINLVIFALKTIYVFYAVGTDFLSRSEQNSPTSLAISACPSNPKNNADNNRYW
jgi:hypothetical protein